MHYFYEICGLARRSRRCSTPPFSAPPLSRGDRHDRDDESGSRSIDRCVISTSITGEIEKFMRYRTRAPRIRRVRSRCGLRNSNSRNRRQAARRGWLSRSMRRRRCLREQVRRRGKPVSRSYSRVPMHRRYRFPIVSSMRRSAPSCFIICGPGCTISVPSK
jgi:hypothetical protein